MIKQPLKRAFLSTLALVVFGSSASLFAETYLGIVQGLPGEDYYQRQFDEQVAAVQTAAENLGGATDLQLFSGEEATKANVLAWLGGIAEQATASDRVAFYYIGHGSHDDRVYKFNIPGPDLTSEELKQAFSTITSEMTLLVNTSSSSGALLEVFEPDSKTVIITATKSGRERNAPRFGRFLVEALTAESADLDKNELISAKEAFEFAQRQTTDFYESEGLIATEHAVLQGERASLFTLASLTDMSHIEQSPELAELYQERNEVDLEIERLRMRRIGMSAENYRKDFQSLMIELSLLQAEIDAMEGTD